LELWLASKEKSGEGLNAGGIVFTDREWNNSGKHHWYKADKHFAYDTKSEAEMSVLIQDVIAILNDLIKYQG
jgi:hypothetical protein